MTHPDPAPPRGGTLLARARHAGLVILAFAALAWADANGLAGVPPPLWLVPLAVAVTVGGIDEYVRLVSARGVVLPGSILRAAGVAIVLAAAVAVHGVPEAEVGVSAVVFAFAVVTLFVVEIVRYGPAAAGEGRALERLGAGVLALVVVPLPLAFMMSLRLLAVAVPGKWSELLGILPLVSLVAVAKAGDIAAYLGGTFLGRTRMAPVISPGKTWEGAAASLVGSVAASWWVVGRLGAGLPAQPRGGWLAFGVLVGVAAMLGDLAESLLKRECGAKDSGRTLGGLGGVLDLVDSFVFSAPVAWLLWVAGCR